MKWEYCTRVPTVTGPYDYGIPHVMEDVGKGRGKKEVEKRRVLKVICYY